MSPDDLERHRVELTGYCYRMLGSGFEAEDAVQEAFTRAWSGTFDERRGSLRTWLYAIATNICLDMRRSPQRRAVPAGSPAVPGTPLGEPLPETAWVHPVPDHKVLDPADATVARHTVRLAFVAALQHLPPRQRAVLVLRDVLCWRAAEVADLLGTTVASVTSALQRARAAFPAPPVPAEVDQALLDRYCAAFTAHDVPALVALLHEDATMTMPPFAWWLRGRDTLAAVLTRAEAPCKGATLRQVRANGDLALAQYAPDGSAFAIVLVETAGGLITATHTHLDPRLFPLFDLPMSSGSPLRIPG
ncbi:RNA polymerase subunit sigma-70 [Actinokineospora globicatena]|uniref:RNA polymerase subunit sigma-70 n=1 Tax=Actinokineospora globicatena TaxID=103729 RepID=UPI0020A5876D|nr:RNA polymerase subunit sigma-70 [Actinokineospora globicatena]MCP2304262.1 RNA polymerase sigma-70 factor, ECF subfamily [Actinokineospora globicatena]GLW78376.1 DNA-directed RNA polymerase sigma-70 factor [Actinokineospora globicatena]GLW84959.1 DNA-directed RNA polymerase sigma-70 factor [Actinokineospora globicatena]